MGNCATSTTFNISLLHYVVLSAKVTNCVITHLPCLPYHDKKPNDYLYHALPPQPLSSKLPMSVTIFYHSMSSHWKTSNHHDMIATWLTTHYAKNFPATKATRTATHTLTPQFSKNKQRNAWICANTKTFTLFLKNFGDVTQTKKSLTHTDLQTGTKPKKSN